jgi:hypothetical protein
MSLTRHHFITTCIFGCAIGAVILSTTAMAKPPKENPGWYVRKDTWQETMRLSREALTRHLEKDTQSVPDAPGGVRFAPWQSIGPFPKPAKGDGWDHVYPPEQDIELSKRHGQFAWKRETRPDGQWHTDINLPDRSSIYMFRTVTSQKAQPLAVYVGCDDRFKVWLNGKLVSAVEGVPRDREVKLPLKAGENQLLLKLYNVSGGKGYSFSLTRKAGKGRDKDQGPDAILWEFVGRDFTSPADQRQMQWEREDGIWNGDWKPGDTTELAKRYAAATWEQVKGDPSELQKARALYHRSRRIEEAVKMAGGIDLAPLRLAINDLTKTFGKRYPDGQQFLDRLAKLEKLRDDTMASHPAPRQPRPAAELAGQLRDARQLRQRNRRPRPCGPTAN